MKKPRIYSDFQGADPQGRLSLSCIGSLRDLASQGVRLQKGLQLCLYDEELEADGTVEHDLEWGWVAVIDWKAIRHASDDAQRNGAAAPILNKEATETP